MESKKEDQRKIVIILSAIHYWFNWLFCVFGGLSVFFIVKSMINSTH